MRKSARTTAAPSPSCLQFHKLSISTPVPQENTPPSLSSIPNTDHQCSPFCISPLSASDSSSSSLPAPPLLLTTGVFKSSHACPRAVRPSRPDPGSTASSSSSDESCQPDVNDPTDIISLSSPLEQSTSTSSQPQMLLSDYVFNQFHSNPNSPRGSSRRRPRPHSAQSRLGLDSPNSSPKSPRTARPSDHQLQFEHEQAEQAQPLRFHTPPHKADRTRKGSSRLLYTPPGPLQRIGAPQLRIPSPSTSFKRNVTPTPSPPSTAGSLHSLHSLGSLGTGSPSLSLSLSTESVDSDLTHQSSFSRPSSRPSSRGSRPSSRSSRPTSRASPRSPAITSRPRTRPSPNVRRSLNHVQGPSGFCDPTHSHNNMPIGHSLASYQFASGSGSGSGTGFGSRGSRGSHGGGGGGGLFEGAADADVEMEQAQPLTGKRKSSSRS